MRGAHVETKSDIFGHRDTYIVPHLGIRNHAAVMSGHVDWQGMKVDEERGLLEYECRREWPDFAFFPQNFTLTISHITMIKWLY